MPAQDLNSSLNFSAFKAHLLRWPHIFTVPLLMLGFALSAFFTGTNTFWYAPPLVCLFLFAGFVFIPGFRHGWDLPRSATVIGVLIFAAYTALSATWSQVPYISILFAFVLTSLPLLFLSLICSPDPARTVRLHGIGAFIVLGGFAVWALIQFFFLYEEYGPRIHHPMLSPNSLAALFIIGGFMALALYFRAERPAVQWGGFALVFLFVMALMVTQSRGGMIFAGISFLVFLLSVRRATGMNWLKVGVLLAALMFCAVTVDYFSRGWFAGNLSALGNAFTNQSYIDRILLMKSSLAMIEDYMWTGIGLGTFYFSYPFYRSPDDSSDGYFVHMDTLQYGVEMGIMGPVIFYGVLIAILFRTIAAMRKLPVGDARRYQVMAPFCAMLAVTMHTHIDFHLYILVSLMAMAYPLAWWYIATAEATGEVRKHIAPPRVKPLVMQVLAGVILFAVAAWPVRAAVSTAMMSAPQEALTQNRVVDAEAGLDRVSAIVPRNYYMYYLYRARLLTQILRNERATMAEDEARVLYQQALDYFDKAQALNKDFTAIRRDRAKLLYSVHGWLRDDGLDAAQDILRGVIIQNPIDWEARVVMAHIYEIKGDIPQALEVLESGHRWPIPRGPMTVKILLIESQFHKVLGNEPQAQALLLQAQDVARSIGMVVQKQPPGDGS